MNMLISKPLDKSIMVFLSNSQSIMGDFSLDVEGARSMVCYLCVQLNRQTELRGWVKR